MRTESSTIEANEARIESYNTMVLGLYRQLGWMDKPHRNKNQLLEPCDDFLALDPDGFTMAIDPESCQVLNISKGLQEWGKLAGHTPIRFVRCELWHKVYAQIDSLDRDYLNSYFMIKMPIPGRGLAYVKVNINYRRTDQDQILKVKCEVLPEAIKIEPSGTDFQALQVNSKKLFHTELDANFRILDVMGEGLEIIGVTRDILVGHYATDLVNPKFGTIFYEALERVRKGKIASWTLPVNNFILSSVYIPILGPENQLKRILGFTIVNDYNYDHIKANRLNESELFHTMSIKHAGPQVLIDLDGCILNANEATYQCFKEKFNLKSDLQDQKLHDILEAGKANITAVEWQSLITGQQDFEIKNLTVIGKNGKNYCHLKATFIKGSSDHHYFVQLTDITEAYNKGLHSERSETLLQTILEEAQIGIMVTDFDYTDVKLVNQAFLQMTNHQDPTQMEQTLSKISKGELGKEMSNLFSGLKQDLKIHGKWEGTISTKLHESPIYLQSKMKVFEWDERKWVLTINVDKTTETKILAHAELQEQRFSALFNSSAIPTIVYDIETLEFIEVNEANTHLLGYSLDQLKGMKLPDLWPKGMENKIQPNLDRSINQKGTLSFKSQMARIDGSLVSVEVCSHELPNDLYGRHTRLATAVDITATEQLTASLQEQRTVLRNVFDKIPYPIFLKDDHKRYMMVNTPFLKSIDMSESDLLARSDEEINFGLHRNDKLDLYETTDNQALNMDESAFEHSHIDKDGQEIHYLTIKRGVTIPDAGNCILGISTDITERKNAELKLSQSQALFQDLFQSSPDALFVIGGNPSRMLDCNQAAIEMFGAADKASLVNFDCHQLAVDNEANKLGYANIYRNYPGSSKSEDILYQSFTGRQFWGSIAITPLNSLAGSALVRIVDITATKNLIKRIENSLSEKDILLREIHHRVKNNLAVIISLLSLQNYQITDPEINTMFVECMNRIRSMAILHEELYKNTNLSKIDFVSYLQNLGSQISATIETNVTVTLTVEGSNVMLDILRAVPCGLIMNELISNSYKHAFRQQQLGQILINLSVDEDNVVIDYRDNGCGKTQERTGKFSLGTMLVTELSKQLRAIVEEKPQGIDSLIGAEPGYRIRIKFPIA